MRAETLRTDRNTIKSVATVNELTFIYYKNSNRRNKALTEGVRFSEKLCEFAEALEYLPGLPEFHGPHVGNHCCILDE